MLCTSQQQSLARLRLHVFLIVQCRLIISNRNAQLNNKMGLQKRAILYSLYMGKTNYTAKIPLTVHLLKGKKKQSLS